MSPEMSQKIHRQERFIQACLTGLLANPAIQGTDLEKVEQAFTLGDMCEETFSAGVDSMIKESKKESLQDKIQQRQELKKELEERRKSGD